MEGGNEGGKEEGWEGGRDRGREGVRKYVYAKICLCKNILMIVTLNPEP